MSAQNALLRRVLILPSPLPTFVPDQPTISSFELPCTGQTVRLSTIEMRIIADQDVFCLFFFLLFLIVKVGVKQRGLLVL